MIHPSAAAVRRALAVLAAATFSAVPAAAQDAAATDAPVPATGPWFGFVLQGAGEFGGDPVATVLFTDGTSQDVHGGQGVTLSAGGEFRLDAASPFALRATVGYKYVTTKATNTSITLTRVPVRLTGTYELPGGFSVGGGYVRHVAVSFDAGGVGSDQEFDDANGAAIELGWRGIILSHTFMTYVAENGAEFDASGTGLLFSYTFGR